MRTLLIVCMLALASSACDSNLEGFGGQSGWAVASTIEELRVLPSDTVSVGDTVRVTALLKEPLGSTMTTSWLSSGAVRISGGGAADTSLVLMAVEPGRAYVRIAITRTPKEEYRRVESSKFITIVQR